MSRGAACLFALLLVLSAAAAKGADEEGCLLCHRLSLKQHPSAGRSDLRVQDPPRGIHESLFCSDCHGDAKVAPHPAPPGPASCLGECHGGKPDHMASHRRASFGGLTEAHRRLSEPAAPCLLCHRADDRPGDPVPVAARCGSCHPARRSTAERGVHGRLAGARETGLCPQCHRPHPSADASVAAGASCEGTGCHASVSVRMRRLAGHGGTSGRKRGPGGVVMALAFAAIASGGWLLGRFLEAGRAEDGR